MPIVIRPESRAKNERCTRNNTRDLAKKVPERLPVDLHCLVEVLQEQQGALGLDAVHAESVLEVLDKPLQERNEVLRPPDVARDRLLQYVVGENCRGDR